MNRLGRVDAETWGRGDDRGGEHNRRVYASTRLRVIVLVVAILFAVPAFAQPGVPKVTSPLYGQRPEMGEPSTGLPRALREVRLEQKLNERVQLDLTFRDETGGTIQLRQLFRGRPVILSLVFYECPMLCDQVLNGLVGSLKGMSFNVGREFDVLTVSFDPRETPELARNKKESYMARYGRPGADQGWRFLVGGQSSIDALTRAVGFHYSYDAKTDRFAHASGIIVLTPEGRISHYFYGIEYAPKDLKLGLVEASANKIGSPVDQLLLYCYHYDPATGKYGPVVMNIMRLGGIAMLVGIAGLIIILMRRRIPAEQQLNAGGGGGTA